MIEAPELSQLSSPRPETGIDPLAFRNRFYQAIRPILPYDRAQELFDGFGLHVSEALPGTSALMESVYRDPEVPEEAKAFASVLIHEVRLGPDVQRAIDASFWECNTVGAYIRTIPTPVSSRFINKDIARKMEGTTGPFIYSIDLVPVLELITDEEVALGLAKRYLLGERPTDPRVLRINEFNYPLVAKVLDRFDDAELHNQLMPQLQKIHRRFSMRLAAKELFDQTPV